MAINNSFTWFYDADFDLGPYSLDAQQQFTLVGLESLRMLKFACRAHSLTSAQIEDVFYTNAVNLFGRARSGGESGPNGDPRSSHGWS